MPVMHTCLIKNCFMQNNAARGHLRHKNLGNFGQFLREPEALHLFMNCCLQRTSIFNNL